MNTPDLAFLKSAKTEAKLETSQFLSIGEKWLRDMGVISDLTLNAIIISLYQHVAWLKDFELLISQEAQTITVQLKYGVIAHTFLNRTKVTTQVTDLVNQYLKGYVVKVEIERFKKEQA